MALTERNWLKAKSWTTVIGAVQQKPHARKLRLFGVACCRRIWHLLTDAESRRAVETAEAIADSQVGRSEVTAARKAVRKLLGRTFPRDHHATGWRSPPWRW